MSSNKVIYGLFDDDDKVLHATKTLVSKGYTVNEVYSPFPVHGLDTAMGLRYSRMAITSFIYGVLGAFLITLLMWYIMIEDWPMVIGGKPNFSYGQNLPAFIPVTFEMTVLLSAFGMVGTFFVVSDLKPWGIPKTFDLRSTDDKHVMAIELDNNKIDSKKIKIILNTTGASEVNDKIMDL